jgi:hypothetical protein
MYCMSSKSTQGPIRASQTPQFTPRFLASIIPGSPSCSALLFVFVLLLRL